MHCGILCMKARIELPNQPPFFFEPGRERARALILRVLEIVEFHLPERQAEPRRIP